MDKYAEMVAERSKSMFEGSKTRAEIDRLRGGTLRSDVFGVTDLINAIATQMMDELEAAGKVP